MSLRTFRKFIITGIFITISFAFRLIPKSRSCLTSHRQKLNDWIIPIAVKNELNVVVETTALGQLVKTKTTVEKGKILLSIPQSNCISPNQAQQQFNSLLRNQLLLLKTGNFGVLALIVLLEKKKGINSKWYQYIQQLPLIPPGVLSWDASLVTEFKQSTTRFIDKQLTAILGDYDFVRLLDLPEQLRDVTYEEFVWAMGVVKSRSLYLDGVPYLVPGIDSISCDPLSGLEPVLGSAGVFGGLNVRLIADRTYEKGEALSMSYGLKSSAECLEDHGVVCDFDIQDASCEITVNIDEETDTYSDDKLTILEERSRFGKSATFDLEADASVGLDPDLLRYLRLKFIQGTDSFILESCFFNTVYDELALPFSRQNELKVFEFLNNACETLLNKINSFATEDTDILFLQSHELVPTDPKVQLAKLRVQERAALKSTMMTVRARISILETVDPTEYYQERRLNSLNLLRPLGDDEIILDGERSSSFGDDY